MIPSYALIALLVGITVWIGSLAFIIPGIIFGVWYCFSMIVFIDEGLKGTAALSRSKELVSGYWWGVFGRMALMFIAIFIPLIILNLVTFGIAGILSFVVFPFIVAFQFLLYEDLKRIKSQSAV